METFNVYITAHPEAADLLAVMLNDKVLASATTMEEALSYAGGYVDGWRKALAEAPRINGPQVNWGAVHAQQKEAANADG